MARDLILGATPAYRRAAAGRAYYALMLESREALRRWGIVSAPRENIHTFVRLRFLYLSDLEAHQVGRVLDDGGHLRNQADYDLTSASFDAATVVQDLIHRVDDAIDRLDVLEADAARLAAVAADLRARWP